MTFEEWLKGVPEVIRADTLWRVEAYRLGLFLSDLAWVDAAVLLRDNRTRSVADQVYRAASNISSNVSEGYSRSTGKGRAIYYEYALGSARETRDWYFKARHVLKAEIVEHRTGITSAIIRLTLTMMTNERRSNRRVEARQGA
jgi:four helix bundle protein